MMKYLIGAYLLLAFILSLWTLLASSKKLKEFKVWQIVLFYILSPVLFLREFFKRGK